MVVCEMYLKWPRNIEYVSPKDGIKADAKETNIENSMLCGHYVVNPSVCAIVSSCDVWCTQ